MPYCVGASGSIPIITKTMDTVYDFLDKSKPSCGREIEAEVKEARHQVYDETTKDIIRSFSVGWEEFKRGEIKEDLLRRKIHDYLDNFNKDSYTVFLCGGKLSDDDEFRLSVVGDVEFPGRQQYSIGTGSDISQIIFNNYFEKMKSEERKDIPLTLGVRMTIDAANAARGNLGVGGTGQIFYVDEGNIRELKSDEVRMVRNLVFDEKRGLVKKETVDDAITGIFNKTKQVEDILKVLESQVDNKQLLREHYTGRLQSFL